MPVIDTNGIRLSYETEGNPKDEPILLIAGLGLQLLSWPDKFCRLLKQQGFYVIRFDNRDSGLSSKLDQFEQTDMGFGFINKMFQMPMLSGYTLYDMALDAVGLLNGLGIRQAHIVGASMGGMIAQIIASTSSQRAMTLTSMMSTSGRPGLPGPTPEVSNTLLSLPDNPHQLDSIIDHLVNAFRLIGSPAYPMPEALLRKQVRKSVERNFCPAGTARQLMAVAASGDRTALLKAIRVPTLVIHGKADPFVPIACGRDTAHLIPDAVIHEIEGMGHDIPPDLEERLAKLIASHCRDNTLPEKRLA